jgi:hypothetical protein
MVGTPPDAFLPREEDPKFTELMGDYFDWFRDLAWKVKCEGGRREW